MGTKSQEFVPNDVTEPHQLREQLGELHPDAWGWALHCCRGRAEDAEEVLQDAYVKVLSGKARYDGRARLRTWFFSVIRFTALDRYRKPWYKRMVELGEADEPVTHEGPRQASEREDRHERLRAALDQLPGRQREVLHLLLYQECTLDESAEVLGISSGSVRQHYERGKRKLRAIFQDDRP